MTTPHDEQDAASVLSRFLKSQIETRIQHGIAAAVLAPEYYVIRSESTGVLSVLAVCSLGGEQQPVKGPASFADCIAYVNAKMARGESFVTPPTASEDSP